MTSAQPSNNGDDNGNNNSGLDITTTGCINLNGNQALALARSRYFEYDDPAAGGWTCRDKVSWASRILIKSGKRSGNGRRGPI